jgi:uncharacterized membrane protein YphA (DoxX/SURF4 family)
MASYATQLDRLEDVAGSALRRGKQMLLPAARSLLLSTFVEDGLRMMYQGSDQVDYMAREWYSSRVIGYAFVLFNLVMQLVPCGVILTQAGVSKRNVQLATAGLGLVLAVQTIAYYALWEPHFFLRNVAVGGSLVLVYAETKAEKAGMFAGLPTMGDERAPTDYLQFCGRLMVIVMYATLLKFDGPLTVLSELVGAGLMAAVAVGCRAKLSALLLVMLLSVHNCVNNAFLLEHSGSAEYDFKKYDFFQTLSVIGGLLYVVALGPGGLAYDTAAKKDF